MRRSKGDYTLTVDGKHHGFYGSPMAAIKAGDIARTAIAARANEKRHVPMTVYRESPTGGMERVHEE